MTGKEKNWEELQLSGKVRESAVSAIKVLSSPTSPGKLKKMRKELMHVRANGSS
jgi:hypothetical protein